MPPRGTWTILRGGPVSRPSAAPARVEAIPGISADWERLYREGLEG